MKCRLSSKIKSCAGFTLIEMLTVVLIVGILMSLALPQYRRVIQRARATEAIRMLRILADSAERLATSFGYRTVNGFATGSYDQFVFTRLDMTKTDEISCSLTGNNKIMICDHFTYTLNADGTITAEQESPDTGVTLTIHPDVSASADDFITCTERKGGTYCALYGYGPDEEEEEEEKETEGEKETEEEEPGA